MEDNWKLLLRGLLVKDHNFSLCFSLLGLAPVSVMTQPPPLAIVQRFRETPVRMICHYCNADVVTATYYEIGGITWLACFLLAVFG